MHRNNHNNELTVLLRIITRLFAMADTAEHSALAAPPVRFFVLWLLSFGEIVAREFAEDLALDLGYDLHLPEHVWQGNSSEDATRLAAQLRALAGLLHVLAAYLEAEGCLASFGDWQLPRSAPVAVRQTSACVTGSAVRLSARAPPLAGSSNSVFNRAGASAPAANLLAFACQIP